MIRSTLIATVLGIFAAAPALYLLTTPARQDPAAANMPSTAATRVARIMIVVPL